MDDQLYLIPIWEWMSVADYMAILLIASSVRHRETVAASSHCTKTKSKYPRYSHCHLVLVMKSGSKVCAVVPRRRSCNPEIHLIGLPNPSIVTGSPSFYLTMLCTAVVDWPTPVTMAKNTKRGRGKRRGRGHIYLGASAWLSSGSLSGTLTSLQSDGPSCWLYPCCLVASSTTS